MDLICSFGCNLLKRLHM